MEQNSLIDVIKTLSNKNSLNNDIEKIRSMVNGYFQDKYINKINSAIRSEVLRQKTTPSNALRLLYALKPYTAASMGSSFMDNVIDAAAAAGAISSLSLAMPSNTRTVSAASTDEGCIQNDGIYEIDPQCQKTSVTSLPAEPNPLIFILLFIMLSGK